MAIRPDTYFEQSRHGVSRWWSWIMVFWFTMLGWLASQLVFTSPVDSILSEVDPELSNKMMEASIAMFSGDNMVMMAYSCLFSF